MELKIGKKYFLTGYDADSCEYPLSYEERFMVKDDKVIFMGMIKNSTGKDFALCEHPNKSIRIWEPGRLETISQKVKRLIAEEKMKKDSELYTEDQIKSSGALSYYR